jgi:hypothetical protein
MPPTSWPIHPVLPKIRNFSDDIGRRGDYKQSTGNKATLEKIK